MKITPIIFITAFVFSVESHSKELKNEWINPDLSEVQFIPIDLSAGPFNQYFEKICKKPEELNEPNTFKNKMSVSSPSISDLKTYNSLSEKVDQEGFSPKERVSRSLVFHFAVTAALRNIYEHSVSSGSAKKQVAQILDENGCNGKVVEDVPISLWRIHQFREKQSKPQLFVSNGDLSTVTILSESDKFYTSDFFTELIKQYGANEGINDQIVSFARRTWGKRIEYSGECGTTVTQVEGICDGQITPETLLVEQNQGLDPQIANGATVAPIVTEVVADYIKENKKQETVKLQADVDLRKQIWKEQEEIKEEIKKIDARLNELKKEQNTPKQETGFKNVDQMNASYKKILNAAVKELTERKTELSIQKSANESELLRINTKWGLSTNPGLHLDQTLSVFIQTKWLPHLDQLAKDHRACVNGKNTDIIFYQPGEKHFAQKCNYVKVINSLNAIAQPPKPLWYAGAKEQKKTLLAEKLDQISNESLPHCLESYDHEGKNNCDNVMNDFYLRLGFEGGLAEYCAIIGGCEKPWGAIGTDHESGFVMQKK